MEIEQYKIWLEGYLQGKIGSVITDNDVNEIIKQLNFAVVVRNEPIFNEKQYDMFNFPETNGKPHFGKSPLSLTEPFYVRQDAKLK